MANEVINLYGDTFINSQNRDTNYCNADRLKYGNDNNGISRAILLFHIDFNFTYKIIKNITLKFRVAAKKRYTGGNILDSSVFMGWVYVYDGSQKDYINEITQRNSSNYLTGFRGNTKVEGLSVNNGDYASISIGVGSHDWNNRWITAVIDGWENSNGYYHGEIYSNDAYLIVEYESRIPTVTLEELESNTINNANPFVINWNYACEGELPQKSYEIGWSSDNGRTWNTSAITSAETWHEFAVNTFLGGTIKLRLRVTNVDDQVSEYAATEIYVVDNVPVVTASYPNEVNLNNSSKSIFTWDYTEGVLVGQKSYEIGWSSDGGANWHTVNVMAGRHYHEYPANTFPVGTIRWRIRATNIYNKTSGYSYGQFTAIGQTAAPVITSVSQDAIPTVAWTSQYQDCYEIRIRQGSRIIYESGLVTGSNVRSFRCNVMLADGVYSVEIRMINTYGYYTEWNTYSYVLGTAKPQAAQVLEVSIQKDYGVKISGVVPAGLKAYVVRKDAGTNEAVIIGVYDREFYDYTVPLNQKYFYTIRTYNAAVPGGYTDGEWKQVFIETDGMVLHDAMDTKNFIHAHFSEATLFQVDRTDTYTKTFHNVIGRKFPVKERMEWMQSQREVNVWLSDADYERIQNISLSSGNVYYRAEKEAFLCDMEIQLTGRYVGGGKFVKISLNRLDEDAEVNLL